MRPSHSQCRVKRKSRDKSPFFEFLWCKLKGVAMAEAVDKGHAQQRNL